MKNTDLVLFILEIIIKKETQKVYIALYNIDQEIKGYRCKFGLKGTNRFKLHLLLYYNKVNLWNPMVLLA